MIIRRIPCCFGFFLFVKDEFYRNSSRRFKAIEQWIGRGFHSPYLYLEAYYLIWQDPYLLSGLNDFTLKILRWATKQDAISKDIALQVRNLLPEQREYQKKWYPVLEKCYEADPSEEMVASDMHLSDPWTAVCTKISCLV
ncbi:MAG: DUF5717 family protein [Roseburia inulinivorans]